MIYISKLLHSNLRIIKRKGSYKDFYLITLEAQKTKPVLKLLHNSLKIKQKQADLCLNLLKTFKLHRRTKIGRFRKLDKRTINKRWKLYKQCRILNYRGKLKDKSKFLKKLENRLKELSNDK